MYDSSKEQTTVTIDPRLVVLERKLAIVDAHRGTVAELLVKLSAMVGGK